MARPIYRGMLYASAMFLKAEASLISNSTGAHDLYICHGALRLILPEQPRTPCMRV
jgi:hypothetical protein